LFSAQQSLITDRLSQLSAEVNLYRALGGGWYEQTQTGQKKPTSGDVPEMRMF
jgi:multidrug efflux system outer membrane protein